MKKAVFSLILFSIFLTACDKEGIKDTNNSSAKLNIVLTDAPADYDAVLIDLMDIKYKLSSDSTWQNIENVQPGIYNLLDFTGGLDTLIGQTEVDTGIIAQIRLILGENNMLVMGNDSIPLKSPSAQQSGLKIKINEQVEGGYSYKIILDFDASKSVVEAGKSGKFILKPVIRAYFEAQDGGITGSISDTIDAVVYAFNDMDSVGTYPNDDGFFEIMGLDEGIWSVTIQPDTLWSDTTITNITVSQGSVTALGNIYLSITEE